MNQMSLYSIITLALTILSCKAGPESEISEEQLAVNNSDFNIAVQKQSSGKHSILVSAPEANDGLGICLLPASDKCTPAHAAFRKLNFLRKAADRTIYRFPEELELPNQNVFSVIDRNGAAARRFKITAGGSNSPQGDINAALGLIQKANLQKDLTYLTRDEWNGRLAGSPYNDQAADWIIAQLKQMGLQPGNNGQYKQAFTIQKLNGARSNNIIGVIPGNDASLKNEYIVIGAHMDHAGTLQRGYTCSKGAQNSNSICNGADDNGSGTISLLHIARSMMSVRSQLKRSVVIMWFSGEEEGLVGSRFFVNNPTIPLQQVKLMINLDMVGYLRQNANRLLAIGTTANRDEFKIAAEVVKKYSSVSLTSSANAQGGSDHAPFMGKGIPAIFFHTGVRSNPNYHKTSDTPDKIDYDGMETVAKIALETLYKVSIKERPAGFGLTTTYGTSLLPPEELEKSCHNLIEIEKSIYDQLDFSHGNDGGIEDILNEEKQ